MILEAQRALDAQIPTLETFLQCLAHFAFEQKGREQLSESGQ